MPLTTPEWLAGRGGKLQAGLNHSSWLVLFEDGPQYRLTLVPIAGKHGCQIVQTINGKRLDQGKAFLTPEEALTNALEELRQALGW